MLNLVTGNSARDSATVNYLKSSIQTANSIIINHVASISDANSNHPSLTKTYTHLRGQYTNDDPPIIVESYDAVGSFTLTKDSLIDRPKTRQALLGTLGSEIVKKYPDQYLLIMGILNPMDTSVAYKDGAILDTAIVGIEPQETCLLDTLQIWVDAFRNKYDLNLYSLTDPYFNHAYLAMLHYAMIIYILNIRVESINTEEAHSFHVRNHLISNGLKAEDISLIPYVVQRQLYKNVSHISRELGKQTTFIRTLGWLSENTDIAFTGYQPALGNDVNDNIVTGFIPVPLVHSDHDILSVDDYATATEKITNLTEDLLAENSPSVGYTKVILTSAKSSQVGSIVNINDFSFYMLLYLVQTARYHGTVVNHLTDTPDINMVTSVLVTGLLKYLGLSESLSCKITVPIVFKGNSLDDTYLARVRDALSLEGNRDHRVLDVMILEDISIPMMSSPSEFISFILDRYNTLLDLQAHVASQPDNIRPILTDVLYRLYPPMHNLKLHARGVMFEDVIKNTDPSLDDYMMLFKTLTTFDYSHAMGPWLDAIVNISNDLTTYSTRFTVDNNRHYADIIMESVDVLGVTITH